MLLALGPANQYAGQDATLSVLMRNPRVAYAALAGARPEARYVETWPLAGMYVRAMGTPARATPLPSVNVPVAVRFGLVGPLSFSVRTLLTLVSGVARLAATASPRLVPAPTD